MLRGALHGSYHKNDLAIDESNRLAHITGETYHPFDIAKRIEGNNEFGSAISPSLFLSLSRIPRAYRRAETKTRVYVTKAVPLHHPHSSRFLNWITNGDPPRNDSTRSENKKQGVYSIHEKKFPENFRIF